ncbi:MAG: Hint domain-containing protein, partial [Polyangiaceae bacterium]|nr:Hint domain-containing protein [Polyangiaceae bacterium]
HGTPLRQVADGQGRVIQTIELLGASELATNFTYDAAGRRIGVTNANGAVTSYAYDGLGRLTQIVHPDAGQQTYQYDDDGNMLDAADALGQHAHHTYDAAGRVLTASYVDAQGNSQGQVTYHYDDPSPRFPSAASAVGRLSWVQDLAGEEHFAYDARGRQVDDLRIVQTSSGSSGEYDLHQAYDNLDHVVTLTYPNGAAVTNTYNERGLLSSISGVVDSIAYDAFGLPTERVLHNGVKTTATYDVHQRMSALSSVGPDGAALQSLTYQYDGAGDVVAVGDAVHAKDARSSAWSFQYDDLYRLTAARGPAKSGGAALTYQYDAVGNVVDKSDLGQYTYPSTGQVDAVASVGGSAVSTDANGSVTSARGRNFVYDVLGQLTGVSGTDAAVSAVYGYNGQRVIKQTQSGATKHTTIYADKFTSVIDGATVNYVFEGDQRIARLGGLRPVQLATVSLERGPPTLALLFGVALLMLRCFRRSALRRTGLLLCGAAAWVVLALGCGTDHTGAAPGVGTPGSGTPVGGMPAVASVYYLADHLGTPTVLTGPDGKVLTEASDDPWGAPIVRDSEPYGFTGQEFDAEAGVYDFGTRFYDPVLARFLSVDHTVVRDHKLGLSDPQQINPYAYSRNNPTSLRDAQGRFWHIVAGAAIGGAFGTAVYTASALYNHEKLTVRGAIGAFTQGAVTGAVVAATGGAGLLVASEASAAANVAGGVLNRGITTGSLSEATKPTDMARDYVTGYVAPGAAKAVGAAVSWGVKKIAGPAVARFGSSIEETIPGAKSSTEAGACQGGACASGNACFAAGTRVDTPNGEEPIEQLRVGDRVRTSDDDGRGSTSVDPATWRDVRLRMPNPDKSGDVIDIEVLRPIAWLADVGAAPGGWISFGLPEMALYGLARIETIGELPPIQPGPGRVVRATVTHFNGHVHVLRFRETTESL